MLLITGLIGMSDLCSFSWAFSVGGNGFFWFRYIIFFLSMIRFHCCNVFCMSFWYLSVGSFWSEWKLLFVRNVCTFLEYSSEFMITIVLPLLASTSTAFSVTSLWFNFFIIYNCHFCRCCGGCLNWRFVSAYWQP